MLIEAQRKHKIHHKVYSVYSLGSRDKRFLFSLSFTRLLKISTISVIFIVGGKSIHYFRKERATIDYTCLLSPKRNKGFVN